MQVAAGFQDPHFDQMPRLNQVLRGVKVQAAWAGKKFRPRLPIIPSILRKIRAVAGCCIPRNKLLPTFNTNMQYVLLYLIIVQAILQEIQ